MLRPAFWIGQADEFRERGNEHFRAQHLVEADSLYHHAYEFLSYYLESKEELQDDGEAYEGVLVSVASNYAATCLKMPDDFRRLQEAKRACDVALELQPTAAKIFYRRATALMRLGMYDEAKRDLTSAEASADGNAAMLTEINNARAQIAESEVRCTRQQRAMMRHAFGAQ